MNEKQIAIIETAVGLIARYGYKKTTMGEVAEQAGISRQALYGHYANKDEIVVAAIKLMSERDLKAIEEGWLLVDSIGEKLDVYFEHAVLGPYDKLKAMPDSNDLMTAINEQAGNELKCASAEMENMLEQEFQCYETRLASSSLSARAMAEYVQISASAFKYSADDRKHLVQLLKSLKLSSLALLGEI